MAVTPWDARKLLVEKTAPAAGSVICTLRHADSAPAPDGTCAPYIRACLSRWACGRQTILSQSRHARDSGTWRFEDDTSARWPAARLATAGSGHHIKPRPRCFVWRSKRWCIARLAQEGISSPVSLSTDNSLPCQGNNPLTAIFTCRLARNIELNFSRHFAKALLPSL